MVICSIVATGWLSAGIRAPRVALSAEPSRPNILIFVTDDQRADGTMGSLPKTEAWFKTGGTWFPNGFVTTPLCCPARASNFTGQYAHNHGLHTNGDPEGVLAFDQSRTMQRYLQDAGYKTGIAGKFLNPWPNGQAPSYFDKWFTGDAYWFSNTYQTNRLGDLAESYLNDWDATADEDPWFLYLAPKAPHSPYLVEPQYEQAPVPAWPGNPAQFEADRSDKPSWVRGVSTTPAAVEDIRVPQLRTLMSVDDMVDRVMSHLASIGEDNTLAFFVSDNGYFWGEHGLAGTKRLPYLDSPLVPFGMRWPGHVEAGATDPRMVANVDLAPTALAAAGVVPPPGAPMDGVSILSEVTRDRLLLEYYQSPDAPRWPDWASTLTPEYQYVEWYEDDLETVSFREYYDLVNDPWQLNNLLGDGDAGNDPDTAALSAALASDRVCAGAECLSSTPPPANDDFANATGLSGPSDSRTGDTNVFATKEPLEPKIAGNDGGASLWYSWIAPATGSVLVDTAGSDFDTLLGVYIGSSVDGLTLVADDNDSGQGPQPGGSSRLMFESERGIRYSIAVDGYNLDGTPATGSANLQLSLTPFSHAKNDFNGDGMADILWRNSTNGYVYLWEMDGATRTSSSFVGVEGTDFVIEGTDDFNGDGMADILWRNSTNGYVYLWEMDGATRTSSSFVGVEGTDFVIEGTDDFNGDGMADILWRNSTNGYVYLWEMDGATRTSSSFVGVEGSDFVIEGTDDFNGDGMADILWRNSTNGYVYLWEMDGATRTSSSFVGVEGTDFVIEGTDDFNGDGMADILWRNSTNGYVYLWEMDGATRTSSSFVGVEGTDFVIEGTDDFNGDGMADILWRNSTNGYVYLWEMDGATRTSSSFVGVEGTDFVIEGG